MVLPALCSPLQPSAALCGPLPSLAKSALTHMYSTTVNVLSSLETLLGPLKIELCKSKIFKPGIVLHTFKTLEAEAEAETDGSL